MWKRSGRGKPQQNAAARRDSSLAERSERPTAADRSSLLAAYKQEAARSSRAPPISTPRHSVLTLNSRRRPLTHLTCGLGERS
jgi:hypothetical protein